MCVFFWGGIPTNPKGLKLLRDLVTKSDSCSLLLRTPYCPEQEHFSGEYGSLSLRRVSGGGQERSLLKAKVKHDGVWSLNGWVTFTC